MNLPGNDLWTVRESNGRARTPLAIGADPGCAYDFTGELAPTDEARREEASRFIENRGLALNHARTTAKGD